MPELLRPPADGSSSPKTTTIKFFKYVVFRDIEDNLRLGWQVSIPNAVSHHEHYGIVMVWLCDCQPACARKK